MSEGVGKNTILAGAVSLAIVAIGTAFKSHIDRQRLIDERIARRDERARKNREAKHKKKLYSEGEALLARSHSPESVQR